MSGLRLKIYTRRVVEIKGILEKTLLLLSSQILCGIDKSRSRSWTGRTAKEKEDEDEGER